MKYWNRAPDEEFSTERVIAIMDDSVEPSIYEGLHGEILRRAIEFSATADRIGELESGEKSDLPRVESIDVEIGLDGKTVPMGTETIEFSWQEPFVRCTSVIVTLNADNHESWRFGSDFAFARPEEERYQEAGIVLSNDTNMDEATLARILERSFSQSYVERIQEAGFETELEYDFRTDAMIQAARIIHPGKRGEERAAEIAVERHVANALDRRFNYRIRIDAGNIRVKAKPIES